MEFDSKRFEELVLYIAHATRDDPRFGRVKLAKVLFYCDFSAFADDGQALTGATYQHWPFGPFPPALYELEERLQVEGRAEVERLQSKSAGTEIKVLPTSDELPRMDHFVDWENWQRVFVDDWINKIAAMPSWQVSDASHQHPGWRLTGLYEEIPYHTVFMSRRSPTREDLARGEQLAVEHGWP